MTTPTDEVIGEATAKSGWPATVAWSGLTEGETYAWYVVSRDADTGDDLPAGEVHQMRVFTATADGTDDVAPELNVPESVTILECEGNAGASSSCSISDQEWKLPAAKMVLTFSFGPTLCRARRTQ